MHRSTTGPSAPASSGPDLYRFVERLYPIMRSVTGPGVRRSLELLQEIVPLEVRAVATGTPVLDWTVPPEWHFRGAWIEGPGGRRVLDAAENHLHVVNFSEPVDATLDRAELEPHLHSLPDRPHAVPYRTVYYANDWGFCLSQTARDALGEGPFRVRIDAERVAGELNWGELYVPGASEREILVSTHVCHPNLANDNLSGMVLCAAWARQRLAIESPFSWRFLFVPGTIGAISWLDSLGGDVPDVVGALVLTGLGDESPFHWKSTPSGETWIDRLVRRTLAEHVPDHHRILPFTPYGYDERQYCSPGFRFPAGRLTRAVHGTFPQYHTSDDDLSFVTAEGLGAASALLGSIGRAIDRDVVRESLCPYGEPQLGRRGLYDALGARGDPGAEQMAMLWLLHAGDGTQSLVDVAGRSGLSLDTLHEVATLLERNGLLRTVGHALDREGAADRGGAAAPGEPAR